MKGKGRSSHSGADVPSIKGKRAAYLPSGYIVDFLRFLKQNANRIELITYDDLDWGDSRDPIGCYAQEHQRWRNSLKKGHRDPWKAYVVLQHDVDTAPDRTIALLRLEAELDTPSTCMIFCRRVNRRRLAERNELEFTEYNLDFDFLRCLETRRFLIGYHCNAYERAHFDVNRAVEIMREDIDTLGQTFDLRYMSAHGGAPGPGGRNNCDLPFPRHLAERVRWVDNGFSPHFDGSYSDGGINNPKRDPAKRDLRDFVRTWRPGRRYRVLIHPQYYHDPCKVSRRLAGTRWYQEIMATYQGPTRGNAWDVVEFPSSPLRNALRWATRAVKSRSSPDTGRPTKTP